MPSPSLRRIAGSAALVLLAALATPGLALAQQETGGGAPLPNPLAPRTTGPQPTLAPQEEGAPPPPPNTEEPVEELTVIAPRRAIPDFQTVDEFHRAEFEAIRGEYEKPAAPPPRDYEAFDVGSNMGDPNTRSTARDMIRNAPSVRETLSGGPPKAEAERR